MQGWGYGSVKKGMIRSGCFFMLLVGWCACGDKPVNPNGTDEAVVVSMDGFEDVVLADSDIYSRIDTIELQTGRQVMSRVMDVCFIDSVLYVLDEASAVWAFSYPSGDLITRIRKVGNGHGEYNSPFVMTPGDSLLYLLDTGQRKVLAYDRSLEYKFSFRIDFLALDFIKVPGGFLFCNLVATEHLHRFIHTDEKGVVQKSYLPSGMELDLGTGCKIFVRDGKGRVFFSEPFSNDFYRWTDSGPVLACRTDYGRLSRKEVVKRSSEVGLSDVAYNTHFFVADGHWINGFCCEEKTYFSFLDLEDGVHLQGAIDTTAAVPLHPLWQHGDDLMLVFLTDEWDKWKPKSGSLCGAVLLKYRLK